MFDGPIDNLVIDIHLGEMRRAIAEMDDPAESLFFKAHLQGMEQLAGLQKKWKTASPDERFALTEQISQLRVKLMESLEVLKPTGA